jgi:nicotinate-nucleotide adenylyltransferase
VGVLIIGQDQYTGLHTWRDWQTLLGLVVLAVANRPGPPRQPHAEVQRLPTAWCRCRCWTSRPPTSASAWPPVRRFRTWCHPKVARYIESHGLYRATPRS